MKKLRVALVLFLIALSLPLSYVLTRTYSGLRQEEIGRLRFFATALFDAMEGELAELILREERRPVDAYGVAEATDTAAPPSLDEAPLSVLPAEPWLRGYLQNHPDGSFQTPLVVNDADTRRRREELAGYNTRFNTIRYQGPLPPPPMEAEERAAVDATTTADKGYADSLLYQTSPSKARSAMTRQEVRLEKLTATQARKVTRRASPKTAAEPAPPTAPPSALQRVGEAAGRGALETPLGEAESLAATAEITSAAGTPQQVEVAPFQALRVDQGHLFLFRRILIAGKAYRQGLIIDLAAFSRHLLAVHFADQPLARFTQLQLWSRADTPPRLLDNLGKASTAACFQMQRRFPRPFAFLEARLVCSEIPPSSARAPLRLTLMVLAAVLLVGLLAIYRSVSAQVALSQRRSQFASAVTHELKTPLTTIRMYVEMLQQGMAGDPQRQKRYFQVLDTETARLGRLINNVLELSRLEKQQRPLTYTCGDLHEVVQKVEAALGPQLKAAGFDFEVENRLREPFAYDAEVLVQVLINLIENSLKFGRDSDRKAIRLTIARQGETVRLAVTDTGPGIPREDLKRIFEDFYRAEDEMTRTTAGTGIGLALVKRFAEAMGGGVTAGNNPSGGCTITLILPANEDAPLNRGEAPQ